MAVKEYPFYLKSTTVLFGLVLLVYVLLALGSILVPFCFAVLIAILLNPLCTWLQKRLPKVLAVVLSLLIAIIVLGGIIFLLTTQVAQFSDAIPALKLKFASMMDSVEDYIMLHFGIATSKQAAFIKSALNSSQALVGRTIVTVLGTIGVVLVIPVYVFLMLFYKTLIVNFLFEVFKEKHSQRVGEILSETKTAIQSYIVGLLIEMLIISTLNSIALLILGVKYAILLGFLGGALNMLPYIGGIIAIALPVIIATVTKDGYSTQFGIIIAYLVIQFIDNNIIFPRFVSIKVRINALVSIIVVLLGNALWGISGMFLSIPFIAILKIIFDRIDDLKPWGKLFGDTVPTRHMGQIWGRRKKTVVEKTLEE
ncbi:AI-2E family transporter [Mucilaginibacter sp. McL0603]|uniref:AI-2E family transporter n=1 Tax=Mucilaginibacter sp. McL0603 TaxID=3415670 RepID=UPI003CE7B54B